MPDYFSHAIAAERVYEKLDYKHRSKITDKTLYLLGAQGPDVFFAYNINPSCNNLGRAMHRKNAVYLFSCLIAGNLSYAAGFATHYALDGVLHPVIYAYEATKRSPMTHVKFEKDLGLYVSRKFAERRQILPRESVLSSAFTVYDSIKNVEQSVTLTGVERCLKRHFRYTRFLYRRKKTEYACKYDFSTLSPLVDEAVDYGVKCAEHILDCDVDAQIFSLEFLQK